MEIELTAAWERPSRPTAEMKSDPLGHEAEWASLARRRAATAAVRSGGTPFTPHRYSDWSRDSMPTQCEIIGIEGDLEWYLQDSPAAAATAAVEAVIREFERAVAEQQRRARRRAGTARCIFCGDRGTTRWRPRGGDVYHVCSPHQSGTAGHIFALDRIRRLLFTPLSQPPFFEGLDNPSLNFDFVIAERLDLLEITGSYPDPVDGQPQPVYSIPLLTKDDYFAYLSMLTSTSAGVASTWRNYCSRGGGRNRGTGKWIPIRDMTRKMWQHASANQKEGVKVTAQRLRADGLSLNDIVDALKVPKSTVWNWVKDVRTKESK